jgi:hypothetical protein
MAKKKSAPKAAPEPQVDLGPRERTEEGKAVAKLAANPAASHAGTVDTIETNVDGVALVVYDGARAVLAVDGGTSGPLSQADLGALRAAIDRAVQFTY